MRVLIATPTYGGGPCPETCASVAALDGAGWEWRQYRANAYPAPDKRNVLAQYQAIRDDFLGGTWDALLTVEHDMVLPADTLAKLPAANAPVVYGVYLLRHGSLVLNAWEYNGDRNLGESLTLRRRSVSPGAVVRVSGVGFGCTLMRRDVVERLPFHDGGDEGQSPDIPFARDCLRAGVTQMAHFGVLCGHVDGDPVSPTHGRVLWPFEDDRMAERKVTAAQTVTVNVGGASLRLEAGQEYTIPADVAAELARAGYVRVLDAPGSDHTDVQAAADAGAQPRKPAKAKRS